MAERGWYLMSRGWMDHPALDDGAPYSRREAWVWLIEAAAFLDGEALRRGQMAHSQRHLSEVWGWPRGTVRRFLDRLVAEGMIKLDAGVAGVSLIAICDYDRHQIRVPESVPGPQECPANGPLSGPSIGPESGPPASTVKHSDCNIYELRPSRSGPASGPASGPLPGPENGPTKKECFNEYYPVLSLQTRAREIVEAFDASQQITFGPTARPFPHGGDLSVAMAWVTDADKRGVSPDALLALARAAFDAEHSQRLADGRRPPGSLKYFRERIADAVREACAPLAPGFRVAARAAPGRAWMDERQSPGPTTIDGELA